MAKSPIPNCPGAVAYLVKHLANDPKPKGLYKVSPSTKENVKNIVKLAIESGAIRRTINQ